jgi:hypothetical protein
MDGMITAYHRLSTGGRGEVTASHEIRTQRPTSVIAQISLSTFDTASAEFGRSITAFGVFTGCKTDGSNPPKPPVEKFGFGSISGSPRTVVIRKGLMSITYELDVENASADFVVNLFLWPSVETGNL